MPPYGGLMQAESTTTHFFEGGCIPAYTSLSKKTYCIIGTSRTINKQSLWTKCNKTDISTKSSLFTHIRHTSTLVFPISSFQPYARWLVHRNWPRVPVDFHLSMPHSQSQCVFHVHGAPVAKKPGKSKVGIIISQDDC